MIEKNIRQPRQNKEEQRLRRANTDTGDALDTLEREKAEGVFDVEPETTRQPQKSGRPQKEKRDDFIEQHGKGVRRQKRHTGRGDKARLSRHNRRPEVSAFEETEEGLKEREEFERGEQYNFLQRQEDFDHLLHEQEKELLAAILEDGSGTKISNLLRSSEFLIHQDVVTELVDCTRGDIVVEILDILEDVDYSDILKRLIHTGQVESVVFYLQKLSEMNLDESEKLDSDAAREMLGAGGRRTLADHLSCFSGLDNTILRLLFSDSRCVAAVVKHSDAFDESIFAETEINEPMTYAVEECGIDEGSMNADQRELLYEIRKFAEEVSRRYRTMMRLLMVDYRKKNRRFTDEIIAKIKERGYDLPRLSIYSADAADTFLESLSERKDGEDSVDFFSADEMSDTLNTTENTLLLNFNLPKPFGRLWYRGGHGQKSISVQSGEIEWGDFYRKCMFIVHDMLDEMKDGESNLNLIRLNGFGQHDYKKYYYLFATELRDTFA